MEYNEQKRVVIQRDADALMDTTRGQKGSLLRTGGGVRKESGIEMLSAELVHEANGGAGEARGVGCRGT